MFKMTIISVAKGQHGKIMSICYRTGERKFTLSGQLDPVFALNLMQSI